MSVDPAGGPSVLANPTARHIVTDALKPSAERSTWVLRGSTASGGTELLEQVRTALTHTGTGLWHPRRAPQPGEAAVVDDVTVLSSDAFAALCKAMEQADRFIVVHTPLRSRDDRVARILDIAARTRPAVTLTPLRRRNIAAYARAVTRQDLLPMHVQLIFRATGGLASIVDEVLRQYHPSRTSSAEATINAAAGGYFRNAVAELDHGAVSTLALMGLPVTLSAASLAAVMDIPTGRAADLIDEAHNTGFVAEGHGVIAPAAAAVRAAVGTTHLSALRHRLLDTLVDSAALTVPVAAELSRTIKDDRLAAYLVTAARGLTQDNPRAAVDLFAAGAQAGASGWGFSLAFAEASFRVGDIAAALDRSEQVIAQWDPGRSTADDGTIASAVRIAAHGSRVRGMAAHAADLYRWLGPERAGSHAPHAGLTLAAAGEAPDALDVVRVARARSATTPPTATQAKALVLTENVLASLRGDGVEATANVARAAAALCQLPSDGLEGEHPSAIAAIMALHTGQPALAERVATQGLQWLPGAATWTRPRLAVLHAWTAMCVNEPQLATERAAAAPPPVPADAVGQFWAHALAAGLARRAGDETATRAALTQAEEELSSYSIDLLSLLPLGELWVAAAQYGQEHVVAHWVRDASSLLGALGSPPMWVALHHWHGVQAGVVQARPDMVVPHARALARAAQVSPFAAVLTQAGQVWSQVMSGEVHLASVDAAAKALGKAGLPWDGARLAGDAAARSGRNEESLALLHLARLLRRSGGAPVASGQAAEGPSAAKPSGSGGLSGREVEVAELVLRGLPYKEIGSQLFISAKTVEHHVARIRQRIGAQNRAEMLTMLRSMGFPRGTHSGTAR